MSAKTPKGGGKKINKNTEIVKLTASLFQLLKSVWKLLNKVSFYKEIY